MKQRARSFDELFLQGINPVIRLLIVSDVLIMGAAGMWAPLFAIYVEDFVVGGNALVVSIGMAIFLFSRSLFQIPIALLIDSIRGERDDYLLMVIFTFLSSLLLLSYLFVSQPWHLYLVQLSLGLASAITFPSYMALFSRHLDTFREGTEWGMYYTFTDLSSAFLAVVGGYVATVIGFESLIVLVSAISVAGSALLLPIGRLTKLR